MLVVGRVRLRDTREAEAAVKPRSAGPGAAPLVFLANSGKYEENCCWNVLFSIENITLDTL